MNLILPIDNCRQIVADIQVILEQKVAQEPSTLMEYLNDLSSMLGTSAQIISSVQYHVESASLISVSEAKKDGYSPQMAKVFIEGRCAEIRALYKLAERQNAALVHRIDATRSILSFTKQEMYHSNTQR